MAKLGTKNKIVIIGMISVIIILSSIPLFRLLCQGKEKSQTSLIESSGEICFYEQTNDPNVVAIGMIIKNESSLVFLWNKTANTTEIETEYKPITEDEKRVFNIIIEKGVISTYTGNRIVPCNFSRISENTYHFKYYDGWELHWSFGDGKFYLNNQTIEWIDHVKG